MRLIELINTICQGIILLALFIIALPFVLMFVVGTIALGLIIGVADILTNGGIKSGSKQDSRRDQSDFEQDS